MNEHPILKKKKLEKEVEKCFYKLLFEKRKFYYNNACINCDGCMGLKGCPDYTPKSKFGQSKYLQKIREGGM